MKLSTRLIRRVGATAAATAAALLIPAVALAAPGRAAGPAAAPRCAQAQLQTWIGLPGDGTAGHTFYELEFSNISARTCSLAGYPGVSARFQDGKPVGSPAVRSAAHPVRLVTLARGATAHVSLGVADVLNFPAGACHPGFAASLLVFAPNDFQAQVIPFSVRACQKAGPRFLTVTPVVAGTGIPAFSN
jgi:hypothetical protein